MILCYVLTFLRDEVLYHAKLHPEQYSDTFSSEQIKRLHNSIIYVCQTAIDVLSDSDRFPEDWLFKYRWGKGKKDAPTSLPNGAKMTFLKVGGRTSCVVPSVQKKTGAVAADIDGQEKEESEEDEEDSKTKKKSAVKKTKAIAVNTKSPKPINGKGTKRKAKVVKEETEEEEDEEDEEEEEDEESEVEVKPKSRKKAKVVKKEEGSDGHEVLKESKPFKTTNPAIRTKAAPNAEDLPAPSDGRRRSGRNLRG